MTDQLDKLKAWGVHLFTASGLLAAFMALIAVDQLLWKSCFVWLFICFIIDAIDGSLARKFRVEQVLPYMDGKYIDYVIDFASYAIIPSYFFYKAEMVCEAHMPYALTIMLLSSALYYGKKEMVADGQYFVGFPVLWNFVVFFQFFITQNNKILNLISVVIIGALHFVPLKFAYPSRSKRYFWIHFTVSIVGLTSAAYVLYLYPQRQNLAEFSVIIGGAYFLLFAVFDTFKKL